jgi:hypothetical protein
MLPALLMILQQAKCMTDRQRNTIKNILTDALESNAILRSQVAVMAYLEECSLSDDLLQGCRSEIIDCWLSITANCKTQLPERSTLLLSPSESVSDGSHLGPSDSSQDGDNGPEKSEVSAPTFVPDVRSSQRVEAMC